MDYKTSLLIYRTQTINVNDIWNSKARLIKNLTPLLRKLNDHDFELIKNFNSDYETLVSQVNSQLNPLILAKSNETDLTKINQIKEQISSIKLQYLTDCSTLSKNHKNDKILELESRTKLLVLLYCTWSEAVFKKLKHTPHGLLITQRENSFGRNIEDQWKNLIDTILGQITLVGNDGDIDQMKTELINISDKYIVAQSKLRNKIAHGQWSEALNGDNSDLMIDTSFDISKLDIVKIDVSFDIHNFMVQILESILESNDPDSMILSRHDSYLFLKEKLDTFISKRNDWGVNSRANFVSQRSFDTRNIELAKQLKLKNVDTNIIKEVTGVEIERL